MIYVKTLTRDRYLFNGTLSLLFRNSSLFKTPESNKHRRRFYYWVRQLVKQDLFRGKIPNNA